MAPFSRASSASEPGCTRPSWLRLAAGFSLLTLCASGGADAADPPRPRLQGTFLQLSTTNAGWSPETWRQLFRYLERLRVSQLVVQWTVYGDTAFYATERHVPVAQPPLETILTLADRSGMSVMVGLAHDPGYWSKISREPELVEVYFTTQQRRSEAVARELAPVVGRHPSFRGWYITEEIEDSTWKDPRARAVLLARLGTGLRAVRADAKIAISGFSNAATQPATFAEFWTALLRAAPIDVWMFQDGIGAGKQQLSYLPLYLDAARDVAAGTGRELQVIVVVFEQVNTAGDFKAVPAALTRVERQLDLAAARSTARGPLAFSIPEYMTPLGGPAAERLFDAYVASRITGSPD
jgi:hypothetical protein